MHPHAAGMDMPSSEESEEEVERSARLDAADEDGPKLVQVRWADCRAGGWEGGGRHAWAMRFAP